MSTTTAQVGTGAYSPPREDSSLASLRYNWAAALLSTLFTAGLFLDGWAHNHGKVDQSFFTPWHAVFYSGFLFYALFLTGTALANRRRGRAWQLSIPQGYQWSLAGAGIFAVGGLGDLIWHTLFGIEEDIQALLSPTHLMLGLGMILMVTGPLRAAWVRPNGAENRLPWKAAGPMLLSLTMLLSIFTFFTQYAHPAVHLIGDNTSLADSGSIYIMNADGSMQTRMVDLPGRSPWSSSWSPDGSKIAFTAGPAGDEHGSSSLYVMAADSGAPTELLAVPEKLTYPVWSPDGSTLAIEDDKTGNADLYLIGADGSNLRPLTNTPEDEYWQDWSPDGTRLAYSLYADPAKIMIANADGSSTQELPIPLSGVWGPAWSPDGSRIAFTSDEGDNSDVYTINVDGTGLQRVTTDPSWDGKPDWSPDGSRLVFVTWRNDNGELFVVNADGSNERKLTNNAALQMDLPVWSPDGKKIMFTANGQVREPDWLTQPVGITGVLLQTTLLMGLILLAVRRWRLPFGALALVLGLNAVMIGFMNDTFSIIITMLLAGLIADSLYLLLKPWGSRARFYLFAFLVPGVMYTLYFATVALTSRLTWIIHLWTGAIVLAGVAGLLLAILMAQTVPEPAK